VIEPEAQTFVADQVWSPELQTKLVPPCANVVSVLIVPLALAPEKRPMIAILRVPVAFPIAMVMVAPIEKLPSAAIG
jgi:hypothetical protein